jgi:hypothetical protein
MATMCDRPVADPVPAAHGSPALAPLPAFAKRGHRAHPHSHTELTAEASKEPERPDATQRLDVLRLAT